MIESLVALSIVGIILVFSDFLLKKKVIHGEVARKFVHIIAGSFMASWAFFLDVRQIQILSCVLLIGVVVSKNLKIFGSVYSVTRRTWGEAFFAASIGLSATFAPSPWIYMAAILHMSLADGMAAVIGTKFGRRHGYRVFGQYKTLIGTFTFFVISFMITAWLVFAGGLDIGHQAIFLVIWLPVVMTMTENLAIAGADNLAVPMIFIAAIRIVATIYK